MSTTLIRYTCQVCGGALDPISENNFKCRHCGSVWEKEHIDDFEKILAKFDVALREQRAEDLAKLARRRYEETRKENVSNTNLESICNEILNKNPDDFYSQFYLATCKEDYSLPNFLNALDVNAHYYAVEQMLEYLIRGLQARWINAVSTLIEKAYKKTDITKYNHYRTRLDAMAESVEEGIFEPGIPRDIFIAYSGQDMGKVNELLRVLEDENGLSCFVAARNLRHGSGAVENYQGAINTALESCKAVVFVSSHNSRNLKCEAMKELAYIKKNLPDMWRIELLINDYRGTSVERVCKDFFADLEYCTSPQQVADRYTEKYMLESEGGEADKPLDIEAEIQRKLEEALAKQQAEAAAKREAEEEAEAKRRAEAEEKRKFEEETRRRIEAEYAAKMRTEAEARRKAEAEAEARRKFEEETRRKLEAEYAAKFQAEATPKSPAQAEAEMRAEAARRAEAEAKRLAEEEARRKAEVEAKYKAEVEAKYKAEAMAKRKAEEEARRTAAAEARRKAEEEARRAAEAKRIAEADAKRKAEAEAAAKRKAEEEAKRKAEYEARRRAEEEARLAAEEEAKLRAEAKAASPISDFVIKSGVLTKYKGKSPLVAVPESATSLGKKSFTTGIFGTDFLERIFLHNGITSIGNEALWGCKKLERIDIPDSVKTIGSCAFSWCDKLERVTMGNGVTSIGGQAFSGCISLTSLVIPDTVKEIDYRAFNECKSLKSVVIPANVKTIGWEAFSNCVAMETIYCEAASKPAGWDTNWSKNCPAKVVWGYKG